MSALFNFHSFLTVVLLGICTCTYVKMHFPAILEQRTGYASSPFFFLGFFFNGRSCIRWFTNYSRNIFDKKIMLFCNLNVYYFLRTVWLVHMADYEIMVMLI
uniref:Protein kish n=1 Tax=Rhizophora mucronata TaxID=61149 RepID=A0A2P2MGR6_RHIMU